MYSYYTSQEPQFISENDETKLNFKRVKRYDENEIDEQSVRKETVEVWCD